MSCLKPTAEPVDSVPRESSSGIDFGLRLPPPVGATPTIRRTPQGAMDRLAQKYQFSTWDLEPDSAAQPVNGPEIRIMTSFNTTEEQVDQLAADMQEALGR